MFQQISNQLQDVELHTEFTQNLQQRFGNNFSYFYKNFYQDIKINNPNEVLEQQGNVSRIVEQNRWVVTNLKQTINQFNLHFPNIFYYNIYLLVPLQFQKQQDLIFQQLEFDQIDFPYPQDQNYINQYQQYEKYHSENVLINQRNIMEYELKIKNRLDQIISDQQQIESLEDQLHIVQQQNQQQFQNEDEIDLQNQIQNLYLLIKQSQLELDNLQAIQLNLRNDFFSIEHINNQFRINLQSLIDTEWDPILIKANMLNIQQQNQKYKISLNEFNNKILDKVIKSIIDGLQDRISIQEERLPYEFDFNVGKKRKVSIEDDIIIDQQNDNFDFDFNPKKINTEINIEDFIIQDNEQLSDNETLSSIDSHEEFLYNIDPQNNNPQDIMAKRIQKKILKKKNNKTIKNGFKHSSISDEDNDLIDSNLKISLLELGLITIEIIFSDIPNTNLLRQKYYQALFGQLDYILNQNQNYAKRKYIEQQFFETNTNDNALKTFQFKQSIDNINDRSKFRKYYLNIKLHKDADQQQIAQRYGHLDQLTVYIASLLFNYDDYEQHKQNICEYVKNQIKEQLNEFLNEEIYYESYQNVLCIRNISVNAIKNNRQIVQYLADINKDINYENMNSINKKNVKLFNNLFLDNITAFNPKPPKFSDKIYKQFLSINLIQKKHEMKHCLINIIYFFENLKNPIEYNQFMINFMQIAQGFTLNIDSKYQRETSNFEYQQILQGQIKDLINTIVFDYKIKLGIFLFNSFQHIDEDKTYQLIVYNNHVFLTFKEKLEQFKQNYIKQKRFFFRAPFKKQKTKFGNIEKHQGISLEKHSIQKKKQLIKNFYIDIETYDIQDSNGKQGAYIICLIDDENQRYLYQGEDCVLQFKDKFIKNLLNQNQDDEKAELLYFIWCFNGGKFDYLFFIDDLIKEFQVLDLIGTQTNIKQLQIDNIYFKDILQILPCGSLKKQVINFGLPKDFEKQEFNIAHWTLENYLDEDKLPKVIEYCFQDCKAVKGIVGKFFDLINEFIKNIKKDDKVDYKNIFSSSGLSVNLFKMFYLEKGLMIKSSSSREIYQIERDSYYGGMTINLKRYGENLNYYDINSSYPYIMREEQIPYDIIKYGEESELKLYQNKKNIVNYVNNQFFYTEIMKFTDQHLYLVEIQYKDEIKIPCTPVRTKEGLLYPLQIEKSWRWGKEINFLLQQKLVKHLDCFGCIRYQKKKIFKDYINDLYNLRKNIPKKTDGSGEYTREDLRIFYKLLMNGLYGKFGQRQFGENHYVDETIKQEYLRNPLLNKVNQISDNCFKIELASRSDLNFIGSLVRIASYITCCARINLMQYVHSHIGQNQIFYMDTDSIVTSGTLPKDVIGDELGQWKLEDTINFGLFLSPKVYMYQNSKGQMIHKAKGVKKENLNDEFYNILKEQNQIKIINKDVFLRQPNAIFIKDQQKTITIKDNKRKYIHLDNDSVPYKNIQEYEQVKQQKKQNQIDINQNQNLF